MCQSIERRNSASNLRLAFYVAISFAVIFAAFFCWLGRFEMLDDALIHLRFAAILHTDHMLSYDGVRSAYGTSSLLYVGFLAVFRSITLSPLLPKVVSTVAYTGLLGLVIGISRSNRFALAALFALAGPFAVRWLTDGMETSLACVLAVIFAMMVYRRAPPIALGIAAALLSILRVDLTVLAAVAIAGLAFGKEWRRAAFVAAGSAVSLTLIWYMTGHLLPDTAIAKANSTSASVFSVTLHEICATFSFGIGAFLIWIVSAASAIRSDRRTALIYNSPLPAILLIAVIRGQQVAGMRYFIAFLLFSIVWNLLACSAAAHHNIVLLPALLCAFAISWIFEFPLVARVDRGRTNSLRVMEDGHLDRLKGTIMAADVGYIGYFSNAPICDINGLVNGRATAMLPTSIRAHRCVAANPTFLFLSAGQRAALRTKEDIGTDADWIDCGSVDFTNVNSDDRHSLWVRRTSYPAGCPAHL